MLVAVQNGFLSSFFAVKLKLLVITFQEYLKESDGANPEPAEAHPIFSLPYKQCKHCLEQLLAADTQQEQDR